jgi:hypothetical protein
MNIAFDPKYFTKEFYTSAQSNFCYVPIYKNAHGFGIKYFESCANFTQVARVGNDKKFIIFLRDPFERWISGITEYFSSMVDNEGKFIITHEMDYFNNGDEKDNPNRKFYKISDELLKVICDSVELDIHTTRQIYTLLGLNVHKCIFLNCSDKDFNQKMHKFVEQQMKIKNFVPDKGLFTRNRIEFSPFKLDIREQVLDYLKCQPSAKERILHFYRPDYDLIQSIKFYQPW